jgi:hypothetical protein
VFLFQRHRHGADIDAHAAQLRLNQAPVAGFEPRVGARTTMRLLNAAWAREYGRPGAARGTSAGGGTVVGAPRLLRAALELGVTLVATRARPEKFAQLRRALAEDGRLAGTVGVAAAGGEVPPTRGWDGEGESWDEASESADGEGDVVALLLSDAVVGAARRMLERLRLARLRGVAAGGPRSALAGKGGSAPSTGALAVALAVSGVCDGPVRLYGYAYLIARCCTPPFPYYPYIVPHESLACDWLSPNE